MRKAVAIGRPDGEPRDGIAGHATASAAYQILDPQHRAAPNEVDLVIRQAAPVWRHPRVALYCSLRGNP
jgi:hypothetical protein